MNLEYSLRLSAVEMNELKSDRAIVLNDCEGRRRKQVWKVKKELEESNLEKASLRSELEKRKLMEVN